MGLGLAALLLVAMALVVTTFAAGTAGDASVEAPTVCRTAAISGPC